MIYIVMLFLILYLYLVTQKEGFQDKVTFVSKVLRNEKVYDAFYAYHYDDLRLTMPYLTEMTHLIVPYFQSGSTLCLGSRNGHVVQLLSNFGAVGAETSSAMVDMSRYKYPELTFVHGDYSVDLFAAHSFSQIVVPLWNIHSLPKLPDLLLTMKEWTSHTGYLFLCCVDLETFPLDRMIPSPSDYFQSQYEYRLEMEGTQLREIIQDLRFKVRTHLHDLVPYSERDLVEAARSVGWTHRITLPFESIPMSIVVFQNK